MGIEPIGEKGKAGFYSVDKRVLQNINHEIGKVLIEYKEMLKLKRDFFDKYSKMSKIQYNVDLFTIPTGRLAVSNPNVNQVPKDVRIGFIPHDGYYFIQVDMEQIELVLILILAGCTKLIKMWEEGKDLHKYNASKIFGVDEEEVTKEQRQAVKTITYRFSYGGTPRGLAEQLSISLEEAVEITEKYFESNPELRIFQKMMVSEVKKRGYVKECYGRIRYLPEINSMDFKTRGYGERVAVSHVIQGTASSIFRQVLIKVMKIKEDIKVINPVHDSFLLEISDKIKVKDAIKILKKALKFEFKGVELRWGFEVGRNWRQMVEVNDRNYDIVQWCLNEFETVKKWRENFELIESNVNN
jgi:DNA polymerase-1